ncbi:MAG: glycerol kinase GlpK [Verrucomicrobiota bacterium]|nr:glycerol kinase GlpK [Verrucomicrobiota bacterium]
MKPQYILAIDQGTTSSRAIVFNKAGAPISIAQRELTQYYPRDGWVEHEPMEIWSSQSAVTAEAVSKAGLGADNIAAVGITNQRETTLVWDRITGEPVYRAIVWQDRRTAPLCRQLVAEGVEPLVTAKTGLRLDPYFSGTKLAWILDNVPGVRQRAERGELAFGTVDSWLLWNFTDGRVHNTDATNASRTLLYNIHTGNWDDELLKLLRIPHSLLPEVKGCSEVYGEIAPRHFPGGVRIAGSAGDQQAALFGQACFETGMAKNTYGTGCFLLMNTGSVAVPSKHNLLTTLAWRLNGKTEYALEGSVFVGGAVIQWLRDELRIITTASECDQLASTASDNGGVYLVPAFAGLGAPHWDPFARGAIFGLTRGANRSHLCRAALESIAFQTADLIHSMEADSHIALKELRVDGGASRSQPLMQFQADLLRVPVIRPRCIETTALGAAYLAGLAVGYWEGMEDIRRNWQMETTFQAQCPEDKVAPLRKQWDRAVDRAKRWVEADAG